MDRKKKPSTADRYQMPVVISRKTYLVEVRPYQDGVTPRMLESAALKLFEAISKEFKK